MSSESKQMLANIRKSRNKEGESNQSRVGYYLVHNTGRFFISEHVSSSSLETVANKVLTDSDYEYWIDYSFGFDINRVIAWSNIDHTDSFI